MQTLCQFIQENLPVCGIVAGVIIPAILFFIMERGEVNTLRRRY